MKVFGLSLKVSGSTTWENADSIGFVFHSLLLVVFVSSFVSPASQNNTLTLLDLSHNPFGSLGISAIVQNLRFVDRWCYLCVLVPVGQSGEGGVWRDVTWRGVAWRGVAFNLKSAR